MRYLYSAFGMLLWVYTLPALQPRPIPPIFTLIHIKVVCTKTPLAPGPGNEGLFLPSYRPAQFDEALSSRQYSYQNYTCYVLVGHETSADIPVLVQKIFDNTYGRKSELGLRNRAGDKSSNIPEPDTYLLEFAVICTQDSNFVHNVHQFVPGSEVVHSYKEPAREGTCYVIVKTHDPSIVITSDMLDTALSYIKFWLNPDLP